MNYHEHFHPLKTVAFPTIFTIKLSENCGLFPTIFPDYKIYRDEAVGLIANILEKLRNL